MDKGYSNISFAKEMTYAFGQIADLGQSIYQKNRDFADYAMLNDAINNPANYLNNPNIDPNLSLQGNIENILDNGSRQSLLTGDPGSLMQAKDDAMSLYNSLFDSIRASKMLSTKSDRHLMDINNKITQNFHSAFDRLMLDFRAGKMDLQNSLDLENQAKLISDPNLADAFISGATSVADRKLRIGLASESLRNQLIKNADNLSRINSLTEQIQNAKNIPDKFKNSVLGYANSLNNQFHRRQNQRKRLEVSNDETALVNDLPENLSPAMKNVFSNGIFSKDGYNIDLKSNNVIDNAGNVNAEGAKTLLKKLPTDISISPLKKVLKRMSEGEFDKDKMIQYGAKVDITNGEPAILSDASAIKRSNLSDVTVDGVKTKQFVLSDYLKKKNISDDLYSEITNNLKDIYGDQYSDDIALIGIRDVPDYGMSQKAMDFFRSDRDARIKQEIVNSINKSVGERYRVKRDSSGGVDLSGSSPVLIPFEKSEDISKPENTKYWLAPSADTVNDLMDEVDVFLRKNKEFVPYDKSSILLKKEDGTYEVDRNKIYAGSATNNGVKEFFALNELAASWNPEAPSNYNSIYMEFYKNGEFEKDSLKQKKHYIVFDKYNKNNFNVSQPKKQRSVEFDEKTSKELQDSFGENYDDFMSVVENFVNEAG